MTLLEKISTGLDERSARLAGIGLMLLAIFMFSFGDALGKFLVATYSVGQLLWLRACAALLVLLPIVWRQPVSYTHLRAHETVLDLVCRLLLEKKNTHSAQLL